MKAFASSKIFALPHFLLILAASAFAQRQTFLVSSDASEVKMTFKTNHDIVHFISPCRAHALKIYCMNGSSTDGRCSDVAGKPILNHTTRSTTYSRCERSART